MRRILHLMPISLPPEIEPLLIVRLRLGDMVHSALAIVQRHEFINDDK
jgi:hypothetical protein